MNWASGKSLGTIPLAVERFRDPLGAHGFDFRRRRPHLHSAASTSCGSQPAKHLTISPRSPSRIDSEGCRSSCAGQQHNHHSPDGDAPPRDLAISAAVIADSDFGAVLMCGWCELRRSCYRCKTDCCSKHRPRSRPPARRGQLFCASWRRLAKPCPSAARSFSNLPSAILRVARWFARGLMLG